VILALAKKRQAASSPPHKEKPVFDDPAAILLWCGCSALTQLSIAPPLAEQISSGSAGRPLWQEITRWGPESPTRGRVCERSDVLYLYAGRPLPAPTVRTWYASRRTRPLFAGIAPVRSACRTRVRHHCRDIPPLTTPSEVDRVFTAPTSPRSAVVVALLERTAATLDPWGPKVLEHSSRALPGVGGHGDAPLVAVNLDLRVTFRGRAGPRGPAGVAGGSPRSPCWWISGVRRVRPEPSTVRTQGDYAGKGCGKLAWWCSRRLQRLIGPGLPCRPFRFSPSVGAGSPWLERRSVALKVDPGLRGRCLQLFVRLSGFALSVSERCTLYKGPQ